MLVLIADVNGDAGKCQCYGSVSGKFYKASVVFVLFTVMYFV